jgi:hypothetical protein
MICHFCNSILQDTAPAGELKEVFLLYVCRYCQPHEILYRELYDQETKELIVDAIRIDEFLIIRNYKTNTTELDKTVKLTNLSNVSEILKMDGIWKIPSTDIEMVKKKLRIYTVFS